MANQLVSSESNAGEYCSLALGRRSSVIISYWSGVGTSDSRLMFSRLGDDRRWVSEVVAETYGVYSAIAIDSSGQPWIAYYDLDAAELKVARKTRGAWRIETVVTELGGFAPAGTSLLFTGEGTPYVSYWSVQGVRVASRDANGWRSEIVDDVGSGLYCPLALDVDGNLHICYLDLGIQALKYARRNGAGWQSAATQRVIEQVDSEAQGFTGEHPSLAVGRDGRPRVSFWSHEGLRFAVLQRGSWRVETVAAGEDVGLYTSLALDRQDKPWISYHSTALESAEGTGGGVKLASRPATRWKTEIVDVAPDGSVGGYTSLALDERGVPHIAYYDWGGGALVFNRLGKDVQESGVSFETFVNQHLQANVFRDSPATGSVTLESQPPRGSVELQANGDFTYEPDEGIDGHDAFTFTVQAGNRAISRKATIDVKIPAIVRARKERMEQSGRISRIEIDVEASRPADIVVILQRRENSRWEDARRPKKLQGLGKLKIKPEEFDTDSWRLMFDVRNGPGGKPYTIARSEVFSFPKPVGERIKLRGSLKASEP